MGTQTKKILSPCSSFHCGFRHRYSSEELCKQLECSLSPKNDANDRKPSTCYASQPLWCLSCPKAELAGKNTSGKMRGFLGILYVLNRAFTKSASLPEEMWKLSTVTLEFECCHVTASAHQILCHRVHELFFRMSLKECPRVV